MVASKYYSYDLVSKRATIYLKVNAASNRNEIDSFVEIEGKNYLKIFVTEVPIDGRANKAIVKMLSKTWKLKQNQLEIIKGATSNMKLLEVSDVDRDQVEEMLRNYARI